MLEHGSGSAPSVSKTSVWSMNKFEMEKVAAVAKNKLLLIPRDEDSAMEMWTMLNAFPDKKVTMILPEDADETSFEYDTSVTLTNAKVPCVFQGVVRMTKVRLLMNGAEAPSFVQKTFEIKEQPQNTRTCVVRASINQFVIKDFAMIQKNPGGSCRAWLKAAEIDSKQLGDTWAWQQQGKCITGLLRLDKAAISALLRQSGSSHAGHRWFFEPLRYGDHLPAPYDALPETVWIENNGRTLEEICQAATKEAAKTGMGLKLGLRQVGVRQKRASGNGPPQSKVWRAVGVPRGLDVEDLETIMSAAGFASITVLEKFRWRQQSGFAFRASRSDAQDVIQVKYGTADIAVNLQQRKNFARKDTVPLPGEKRVKFTNHGVPRNPKPQESQDVPMGESKDGDQENGKRSAAELAVENKKAKIVSQIAGFNEIENEGKGDCLFASLSQGLAKQGVAKSTLQCRIQAVTHLRKYCDAYKGHWDGCYPKQQDEKIPDKNFQTYLDHLAKPGSWGSALEVMATSFTLDKPIFVLRPAQECYVFNKNGKRKPLFLKYENQHYTALIPKNEETPAIDNAIEGPHQGMRGAASTAGTRTSVRQRMAPKSTCTRTTIKQVLKKKAGAGSVTQPASTKPHCGAPDACSLALSNFESNASASYGQADKPTHQLPSRRTVVSRTHVVTTAGDSPPQFDGTVEHAKDQTPYVWTCNLCMASTRQKNMRKLTEWRSNHIAYSHRNERKQVNMIKGRITILAAADLPQDSAGWLCSYCYKAIPHAPQNQLRQSARAHLMEHARRGQTLTLQDNWVRLRKKRHIRITASSKAGNEKSLASTRRRVANKNQEMEQSSGHQLVYFPDQRRQKKSRSRWSCSRCYGSWTHVNDIPDKCANTTFHDRLTHPSFIEQWKKLRTMKDKNMASRVANAWKLSQKQVNNLEEVMKSMVKKRHGKLPSKLRSWKRNLTEEGIEPNPGPSSLITIHSLNVNGKHKARNFMKQFAAERKEVAILQEVNLNKEEQVLFANAWSAQGYSVYFPDNVKIALTVVAVHNSLRSRRVGCCSSPWGQVVTVEMQSGIVSGIYRNPRHELDFADMFVAHLQALGRYTNWMAVGDWNLTPDEDDVHCLFPMNHVMHFPREANGLPKSTRWKGSRCIGWCASAPSFCPESIQLEDTYWSDHIMLELTVRAQRYDMPAVVETLDCSRPGDMPLDDWDTACAKLWEKDRSTQLVPRRADEIQLCWDNFNKKLEKVLITAGNRSKSGQIRPKGSCLEFKSTKKPHRQRNTQVVTFQERKCRKLLGRLHEALRQGKMRSDEANVFVPSGFTLPSSTREAIAYVENKLKWLEKSKAKKLWKPGNGK